MNLEFKRATPRLRLQTRLKRIKNRFSRSDQKISKWSYTDFTSKRMKDVARPTISVCVLTKDCKATIDNTLRVLVELKQNKLIDQVVVIDGTSIDGTARSARNYDVEFYDENELLEQFGITLGKGDAMWRSQKILTGEIIVFLDGDLEDFNERHVLGVIGPLLLESKIQFVKGTYRRHLKLKSGIIRDGGGRVSTLLARPLLTAFYPKLSDFKQPLSGECAIRKELLNSIPIATGYGVEIGMLIDVYQKVGITSMAEVDLLERANKHQSLTKLGDMADEITKTLLTRVKKEGRYSDIIEEIVERPPFISISQEV